MVEPLPSGMRLKDKSEQPSSASIAERKPHAVQGKTLTQIYSSAGPRFAKTPQTYTNATVSSAGGTHTEQAPGGLASGRPVVGSGGSK